MDLIANTFTIITDTSFAGCKASGGSFLHIAAEIGSRAIADVLIKHGASLTHKNIYDDQPLHSAARSGSWRCIEMFLIRDGVEVNAQNCQGYTALHLAAMYGHEQTVKVKLFLYTKSLLLTLFDRYFLITKLRRE